MFGFSFFFLFLALVLCLSFGLVVGFLRGFVLCRFRVLRFLFVGLRGFPGGRFSFCLPFSGCVLFPAGFFRCPGRVRLDFFSLPTDVPTTNLASLALHLG